MGTVFRHTFSHFHLDIEPCYLKLDGKPMLVAEDNRVQWYPADGSGDCRAACPSG